jgi:hypothetical protein
MLRKAQKQHPRDAFVLVACMAGALNGKKRVQAPKRKNLFPAGTNRLCCGAVTVADHHTSGIAAKQPNSRHDVWIVVRQH